MPLIVLLVSVSLQAATPNIAFNYETIYPIGANRVKTADLNQDHIPDLVLSSDHGLLVMFGKGDGTFRDAVPIALAGQAVFDFHLADVNRDGKLDIIASSDRVYTILGNGNGTFQKPIDLQISGGEIALADLDGDGQLDLIADLISPTGAAGIRVYLGKGDGSFNAQRATVVLPDLPASNIAVADFNSDGRADVAVNTNNGVLCILYGKGNGDLQSPITLNVGRNPLDSDFVVADFNGDKRPDLAIPLGGQPGAIKILLGNGDGTFQAPTYLPLLSPTGDTSVITEARSLAVADFNGDGIPDIVATPYYRDKVVGDLSIFLGKGGGTFGEPLRFNPRWIIAGTVLGPEIAPQAFSIAISDFNGDGLLDLAIGDLGGELSILINGAQAPPQRPQPPVVVNGAGFIHGDVVVPGEIVSIFGTGIGPPEASGPMIVDGLVSQSNSGVTVFFDDLAAPLLAVSANQINAVVPFEIAHKQMTSVKVQYNGSTTPPRTLSVLSGAPGIFTQDGTGKGQAACLNEDGTLNSTDNPAAAGSIVTIFATGTGPTNPDSVDGQIASGSLPKIVQEVIVGINTERAEVVYAGAAPGLVAGLTQINVRVPRDVPSNSSTPISIQVGTRYSQTGVTIAVQ